MKKTQFNFSELPHDQEDPGMAVHLLGYKTTPRNWHPRSRPKLVDPIDYETFCVKNKVQLGNDMQRDMLNFPHDDVEVPPPAPKRYIRTEGSTVPACAEREATSLMVRQAIQTYTGQCHMVRFKYQSYSGSYQQLPRSQSKDPLQEQVFEIDAESDEKDDDTLTRGNMSSITKKGWLFKGPDSGKDTVISFTRVKQQFCAISHKVLAFKKRLALEAQSRLHHIRAKSRSSSHRRIPTAQQVSGGIK
ncbi:dedicator of cytokinesis protein 9-like [Babylonia areolata]|uniref:dedicator of cytokinesis protein 9-like n=1 Tax=Babylonia areolata TaxID=304850 RepID=UPI003FD2F3DC